MSNFLENIKRSVVRHAGSIEEMSSILEKRVVHETGTFPLNQMNINGSGEVISPVGRFSMNHNFLADVCGDVGVPYRTIKVFDDNSEAATRRLIDSINSRLFDFPSEITRKLIIDNTEVEQNTATALVTEKYTLYTHREFANDILPIVNASNQTLKFHHAEISGRVFRFQMIDEQFTYQPEVGDYIYGGIGFQNGEDGGYAGRMYAYLYRLICKNGAVAMDKAFDTRFVHRGDTSSKFREQLPTRIPLIFNFLKDAPVYLDSARRHIVSPKDWEEAEKKLRQIIGKKRVAGLAQEFAIGDRLLPDKQVSFYRLGNYITAYAKEVESQDTKVELEKFGGRILLNDYSRIANN